MEATQVTMKEFEPKIVGFFCKWCAYQGADLAGTSRMKYPLNVLPIRVMCTGRIDPTYVLTAFAEGADGVLIAGCHLGDCHYETGNYKALRRFALVRRLLEQYGIEPERIRLEWISSSEGSKFAKVVTEMTEEIKKLGPSPLKEVA